MSIEPVALTLRLLTRVLHSMTNSRTLSGSDVPGVELMMPPELAAAIVVDTKVYILFCRLGYWIQ
jgi:hypothetical protein